MGRRNPRYGRAHDLIRKQYKAYVDMGNYSCCYCGKLINPREQWHLAHNEDGKTYKGASHAVCNMTAAYELGQRKRGIYVQSAFEQRPRVLDIFDTLGPE